MDTTTVKEVVSPVSTITNVEQKKKAVGRKKGCKLDLESLESGGMGGLKKKDENIWKYISNIDNDYENTNSRVSFVDDIPENDFYFEYDEMEDDCVRDMKSSRII